MFKAIKTKYEKFYDDSIFTVVGTLSVIYSIWSSLVNFLCMRYVTLSVSHDVDQ